MTKTVLVTGAARGIGRAVSNRFLESDWNLIAHYHESAERAEVLNRNKDVEIIQADLSTETGIQKLSDRIDKEVIDSLINNAGIARSFPDDNDHLENLETVMRVNSTAPFALTRKFAKTATSGTVVNVSSIRGLRYSARPGIAEYSASKSSLENFTASLAQKYAPQIRINAVAPGFTDTDMTSGLDDATRQEVEDKTPMNRFGDPDEIARAIQFLASDKSSFCVGETLVVDGGYSIKG